MAGDHHFLPLVDLPQLSHHGDEILVGQQLGHAVSVFLVAVDDVLHRAPHLQCFRHCAFPPAALRLQNTTYFIL